MIVNRRLEEAYSAYYRRRLIIHQGYGQSQPKLKKVISEALSGWRWHTEMFMYSFSFRASSGSTGALKRATRGIIVVVIRERVLALGGSTLYPVCPLIS